MTFVRAPEFGQSASGAGAYSFAQVPEDAMSGRRAADDFETIRTRLEELRRESRTGQSGPANATIVAVDRGPCACGMSLFPDECDGSCKLA
jgi:hypothetical protein